MTESTFVVRQLDRPFVLDDDSASEDVDAKTDDASAPVAMDFETLEAERCVDEVLPDHPSSGGDNAVDDESPSPRHTAAPASERLRRTQRSLKSRRTTVLGAQLECDGMPTNNDNPHGGQPSLRTLLRTYQTAFLSFEQTRQPHQKRRDPTDYLVPFVPLEHPAATCMWTNFLNVLKEAAADLVRSQLTPVCA